MPAPVAMPGKPLGVSGADYEGVIFAMRPDDRIEDWHASSFWTPTAEDVRRLEAVLPAALHAAAPEVRKPLKEYFRQYVGLVREGRRLVLVFAIHERELEEFEKEEFEKRVLTEPIRVYDGGDGYIDAVYDVGSGTFEQVGPHGDA